MVFILFLKSGGLKNTYFLKSLACFSLYKIIWYCLLLYTMPYLKYNQIYKNFIYSLGMEVHTYNHSTQEAEAGKS
jgi:hypothetical protein